MRLKNSEEFNFVGQCPGIIQLKIAIERQLNTLVSVLKEAPIHHKDPFRRKPDILQQILNFIDLIFKVLQHYQ